ncbi:esterase family protein [Bacillus sp. FJAT-49711]|uniref:alpha/beta hydrolase n=1 Tax=Bacillus sp. FJAT-49711 TaxID=2833585 RepID=UPI001BCA22C8|nr:alpha/beta hydrolase family protein [Bacillus sp. FJAT-49711]MBS4218058.1 esterase family protein [Bacillus sp. FJAT-49711]
MALIKCNFFSDALGMSTSMTVILPQQTNSQVGMNGVAKRDSHPTLWLLHGGSDDDSIWNRRTSIERYVSDLGLAVVMPDAHFSFYTNMAYGGKYGTFLMEELPKIARSLFPLSEAKEDNFVAGLSMGGYGAFKWALSKPNQFAAAAGLSTANFSSSKIMQEWNSPDFLRLVFGEEPQEGTENDLCHLIEQCDKLSESKPKFYQSCGKEDHLYKYNLDLKEAFMNTDLDYTYTEESGVHDWAFWDKTIQDVVRWLPLKQLD